MLKPEAEKDHPEAVSLSSISPVFARMESSRDSWDPRLRALYEKGKRQQWNPTTDLDWAADDRPATCPPGDSYFALDSFDRSGLARYGRPMWDAFRGELQCWMVSQFLPGEQAALVAAARLIEEVPHPDASYCLAGQVADEARHVEVFSRYLRERVANPYPVSPSLAALLSDALNSRRWDITVLGTQIMVEALALAAFRLADRTFHDGLLRHICRLVARDESRHVSVGVLCLQSLYTELSRAELAEREEFAIEAVALVSRRFLLEEIWERLGIDREEGVEFASTNELMVRYRQAVCAKTVSALTSIGLMTERLREKLTRLDLLGFSGARAAAAASRPERWPGDDRV